MYMHEQSMNHISLKKMTGLDVIGVGGCRKFNSLQVRVDSPLNVDQGQEYITLVLPSRQVLRQTVSVHTLLAQCKLI